MAVWAKLAEELSSVSLYCSCRTQHIPIWLTNSCSLRRCCCKKTAQCGLLAPSCHLTKRERIKIKVSLYVAGDSRERPKLPDPPGLQTGQIIPYPMPSNQAGQSQISSAVLYPFASCQTQRLSRLRGEGFTACGWDHPLPQASLSRPWTAPQNSKTPSREPMALQSPSWVCWADPSSSPELPCVPSSSHRLEQTSPASVITIGLIFSRDSVLWGSQVDKIPTASYHLMLWGSPSCLLML